MDDFSFDIVAPRLSGGRTLFRVRNVGGQPHDLYLIPVTDDSPPAKEIFGAAARRQPRAPAAVLRALAPGERGAFAFDLTPGRYALVCLLQTAAGQSHAVLGMAADLRVEGRTSPASGRPAPAVPE